MLYGGIFGALFLRPQVLQALIGVQGFHAVPGGGAALGMLGGILFDLPLSI